MILGGDVGGTKARLAIFARENGKLSKQHTQQYESKKFPNLEAIINDFLATHKVKADLACFGVPGPVVDGKVSITNLPWKLAEKEIEAACGITKVRLVNDLVATAAAIPHFSAEDRHILYEGSPSGSASVFAIVAPGTGLGQAALSIQNGGAHFLASEGGHVSFAPTTEEEIELLRYLKKKFDVVSMERVLCGPGLVNIYSFLRDTGFTHEDPQIAARMKTEDPAAVISKAAASQSCKLCEKALDMFAHALGNHAGNTMLSFMANGGIFLGGGIPPKIISKLTDGTAVKAYLNKGALAHQVKATPLYIIKDDHAALHGAGQIAAGLG